MANSVEILIHNLKIGLEAVFQEEKKKKKENTKEIIELEQAITHVEATLEKAWNPELIAKECLNKFFKKVEMLEGEELANKMKEILQKLCSKDQKEISTITALIEKGQKGDNFFELLAKDETRKKWISSLNQQECPNFLTSQEGMDKKERIKFEKLNFPKNLKEIFVETQEKGKRWVFYFGKPCTWVQLKEGKFFWKQEEKGIFEMETSYPHSYQSDLDKEKFPTKFLKSDSQIYGKEIKAFFGDYRKPKVKVIQSGEEWILIPDTNQIAVEVEESYFVFYVLAYKTLFDTIYLQFSRKFLSLERSELDGIFSTLLIEIHEKGLPSFEQREKSKGNFRSYFRKMLKNQERDLKKKNNIRKKLLEEHVIEKGFSFFLQAPFHIEDRMRLYRELVREIEMELNTREREVILEIFFSKATRKVVGKKLGISEKTVSRELDCALVKLKFNLFSFLENDPIFSSLCV